jgi:PII-like signaling protein
MTLRDVRSARPARFARKNPPPADLPLAFVSLDKDKPMSDPHVITPSDIGMIRIYLKPRDKVGPGTARTLWSSRPLYRELVRQAKADGIMNAVAHHTHYGFSNRGALQGQESEAVNPQLTMCVELIGPRGELEAFCRRHGDLLADKVIVYKHLEHWRIGPGEGSTFD